MPRPTVFFDITIGGKAVGRIVMEVCLVVFVWSFFFEKDVGQRRKFTP